MGDEDDGLLQPRLQAHEFVLQLAPDQRVERREGFVEKPQLRLDRERSCDAHALLLPARKLARKGGLAPRKAHQRDHLARPRLAPLRGQRPAPPAGRPRCRARSDAAAARSAGTPCPSCDAGSAIISASEAASRFWPLNNISPAVGSISRDRQRTSVDLPEPDRPMMTKISPRRTLRSTARTAGNEAPARSARRRRDFARARPDVRRRARRRPSRRHGRRGCLRCRSSLAVAEGAGRDHPARDCARGQRSYLAIHVLQRASLAAIQSATTASIALAVQVDLGDHLRPSRHCRW